MIRDSCSMSPRPAGSSSSPSSSSSSSLLPSCAPAPASTAPSASVVGLGLAAAASPSSEASHSSRICCARSSPSVVVPAGAIPPIDAIAATVAAAGPSGAGAASPTRCGTASAPSPSSGASSASSTAPATAAAAAAPISSGSAPSAPSGRWSVRNSMFGHMWHSIASFTRAAPRLLRSVNSVSSSAEAVDSISSNWCSNVQSRIRSFISWNAPPDSPRRSAWVPTSSCSSGAWALDRASAVAAAISKDSGLETSNTATTPCTSRPSGDPPEAP
mmetsp:Transcript_13490/g.43077  ORF Transcript_13490/g.43077 Transcript_13490/m.43077 type:complete len:273 (-) Transcript_13490:171-989(-)